MAAPPGISAQLRTIIRGQDLTAAEVGRLADVDQGVVSRFLTGRRGLTLDTLDRIAAALGLRLAETGARRLARGRHPAARPRPPRKAARPAAEVQEWTGGAEGEG